MKPVFIIVFKINQHNTALNKVGITL